jgi:hypothetical protein
MRRLTVLAALLALTGCGGHGKSQASRDSVSLYISRVNAVEFLLRKQLDAVSRATVSFSRAHDPAATTVALAGAQQTFIKLHKDVARLSPPPQARKLHRTMLALIAQEAELSGELRRLSAFNPAFADVLRPLSAANASTQKALKAAKKPAVAAAAVHAYREDVVAAIRRTEKLDPPAVERALFDAQVHRLIDLGSALAKLEQSVKARDLTGTAKAEYAVGVASVSSDTRARQLAQRAAVVLYNSRVHAVQGLAASVQRERDRLQRTLP